MGMGYCETGNTKSQNDKFIIPDFQGEIDKENATIARKKKTELQVMLVEARKKKATEQEGYYSVRSIARTLGCDSSSLRRWIASHGIKAVKRVTQDSNRQIALALTKEQVRLVMEGRV